MADLTPIVDPEVAAVFRAYPPRLRARLMALRQLVLDTAEATEGVGPLQETLKWGVPSYLTRESGSGTTVRIDGSPESGHTGLYVHCQTDLIRAFRDRYPQDFAYDGTRAILFEKDTPLDRDKIGHFIAMALTFKLRKKRRVKP